MLVVKSIWEKIKSFLAFIMIILTGTHKVKELHDITYARSENVHLQK